jgi:WhiB family transcriptional regulator, redox-sensing transcriptional regulator
MTTTSNPTPQPPSEGAGDPRPAFERVAYTWLDREVDAGQRLDPGELAAEVSVAPRLAAGLLARLRAARARDPGLTELRARRARDRITDAYVTRELHGTQRLDPATVAAEVGITVSVARQWLHALRAQQDDDHHLAVLAEPASHGHPSASQLAGLAAHFAAGGHQHAAVTGRPPGGDQAAAEVERAYWTTEVHAGRRLDPRQLARQLGVPPHRIAAQLGELRAGPATARERIEQLWRAAQQDPGARPPSSSQLARRLGVSDAYVRHVTWRLRSRAQQPPLRERFDQAHQRLGTPPPAPADSGVEGGWWAWAACRDADPELFFPEQGQLPQTAKAKEVCAGCAVRGPCLQAALRRGDDRYGIVAGTTPRERVALRGRPSMAEGTRFLHDRAAAEQAWQLADRRSVDRASRELGVSPSALRRAFDHHGLGQPRTFEGGPARSRFFHDRDQAEQAWRRAAEVGINQARKELGVSDRALRTAWQHHGLGLPPRPATRQPAPAGRLDPAFVALNTQLTPTQVGPPAERFARVRRAEQEATLGYRVTTELTAENHWPSAAARTWAVRQRAHHAHQRARTRAGERQHERYRSGSERSPARRDTSDSERDTPSDHARRWAQRAREHGGAER